MRLDTLKKIFKYAKRYTPLFVLSIIFATITVVTTLYLPILTGNAIDYIIEPGKVDFATIGTFIKQGIVIMAITALSQWLMNTCNNKMTYGIVRDIRKDAFDKIEILPLGYVDTHSHGEIVSKVCRRFTSWFYAVVQRSSYNFVHVVLYGEAELDDCTGCRSYYTIVLIYGIFYCQENLQYV